MRRIGTDFSCRIVDAAKCEPRFALILAAAAAATAANECVYSDIICDSWDPVGGELSLRPTRFPPSRLIVASPLSGEFAKTDPVCLELLFWKRTETAALSETVRRRESATNTLRRDFVAKLETSNR